MTDKKIHDVIIGIDIGLSGGIVFFDTHSNEVLGIYEMPTTEKVSNKKIKRVLDIKHLRFILEIPKIHGETAIVIYEGVHAFPGQGVVAIATLLEQKGMIRGLASGLGYEEYPVEPKIWQKYFEIVPPKDLKGSNAKKTKALRKKWLKDKSLEVARGLFPEYAETKLAKDDAHGISDSLLIGKYYLDMKK